MSSILRSVFGGRSVVNDPGPWAQGMVRWGGGAPGSSPAGVTVDSAMTLSAVYACLRLLSEAIATMPLDTFVRKGGTRLAYRPRPDYLSFQPPLGSRIDYLSQVMLSLLTDGNAFVATPRDALGVPVALVVVDPSRIRIDQDDKGNVTYCFGQDEFGPLDIMHIKGMTLPGALRGLSPLGYARATVDLGLSAQTFGANFFHNGALPGGVIEAPNEFTREKAELMASMWDGRHRGSRNAARIGVLTNGAKFNRVTIAPEEAQFLQTRQFQVPDIARFYGVPPHLIADASNSTSWGSGLSEQNLAFGQMSLRPWVERIEDAHQRLLTTHGLPDVFVKLNMDSLLRAGTKERYDAYSVALDAGFMVVNEVRKLEDMPPLPGGDAPLAGRPGPMAESVQVIKNDGLDPQPAPPPPTRPGGTP